MVIVDQFAQYIKNQNLVQIQDKILLAVSGGKDSMLMATLFKMLNYDCIIAHCNFKLRGEESDLDEALVREYAQELKFPVHVKCFETEAYASENKISIQMAARDLRYVWFEELRTALVCSVTAVAQHKHDHIETVLFNLTRSTGLLGMTGIKPKRAALIRPLLFLSSDLVGQEVVRLEIPYRDDQSNFSSKYARNKIRLEIIPKFQEIQPDFLEVLGQNIIHFQESYDFIQSYIHDLRGRLFLSQSDYIIIEKSAIEAYINNSYLIFELFKPYGFQKAVLMDMISVFFQEMGQIFTSPNYELLLDREQLILREIKKLPEINHQINSSESIIVLGAKQFSIAKDTHVDFTLDSKKSVQIDGEKLIFPLLIRNWQMGDWFIPLGMEGRKKLSDFFIQEKVNRFEKQTVPILVNGNGEVIWVVGFRLDNRYKISDYTKKVLTLVYI
ncbi:MAG: tRNA lysidine(34) synthetase TilS [Sphingobacterium sp.]